MNEADLLGTMSLPAFGLVPGHAAGPVHLSTGPGTWPGAHGDKVWVAAMPAFGWPFTPEAPEGISALVFDGVPTGSLEDVSIPSVGNVDLDVLREGETVEVDGTNGRLTIDGIEEVPVVTALLERSDGRVLLLERSGSVGSFQGRWAGISGYVEEQDALQQAYREILEEVGIPERDVEFRASGNPVLAREGTRIYVVHPFRFRVRSTELELDWENVRAEWVPSEEIPNRLTVPKLDRVWERVAPAKAPKP
ncbi:MAG TPA: NUDIX domain-containing protein [Thermoplasmata archaeon]|nr:NUDIX domain-containing protein [Thermoplasmata archaeon]